MMNFLPSLKLNRDRAEMISEVPFRFVRSEHLDRLENDQFDLLIIGGGVTGAYAALDASLRGFRFGNVVEVVEDGAWRVTLYRAGQSQPGSTLAAGASEAPP